MRELTMKEVHAVSGGEGVTTGAFVTGAAVAAGVGLALGPVGVGVALVTYSVSFGLTKWMMK